MRKVEKRRHDRINSLNLSYLCVNENNEVIKQGMGRTLNVSESGILMETDFAMKKHQLLSVSIAFENDLADIRGRVIRCRTGRNKKYETGIEFFHVDETGLAILRKFITYRISLDAEGFWRNIFNE